MEAEMLPMRKNLPQLVSDFRHSFLFLGLVDGLHHCCPDKAVYGVG
jgi:hypothetical protein